MNQQEELRDQLRLMAERLPRYASAYRALEQPSFDNVYPLVMGYIRDRFLLTRELCCSERLLELADASLRRMLALRRMGIDPGVISRSCSGASSVITKKVLLMKAVQEVFSVAMSPEEFAAITTVTELTEFICARSAVQQSTPVHSVPGLTATAFDIASVRSEFPAMTHQVCGKPLVYLDNAATAQMPSAVLHAVQELECCRGNVHRGVHTLSNRCTDAYEQARQTCAAFLGAEPGQITFTSGTTDGINRCAAAFAMERGGVVTTVFEHHSNFVPWQQLCLRTRRPFRVCPMLPDGRLDLEALDRLLTPDIGLLTVTQCSNVLGTMLPVQELTELAHSRGIRVLVDGAQSAAHSWIDVQELGCDWFVLSGHKLGAPFGIGLLYSREPLKPVLFGGGMVDRVTQQETTFLSVGEAGTPNVSGAVGMAAAMEYRRGLPDGWQAHEAALLQRAETLLRELPGVRILGCGPRTGCLSITLEQLEVFEAATLLDQLGVEVRSGNHCAQPLHQALGVPFTLRISPAFYNTASEIDELVKALRKIL